MIEILREALEEASVERIHHDLLEKLRNSVRDHSAFEYHGIEVDVQTAHCILTVYDALNSHNKAKLMSLEIGEMALKCWKCIK